MSAFFKALGGFLTVSAPWWGMLAASLVLTLVMVPLVREMNRRLGMVDKPSARRINKTPVPRGGGLAIFIVVTFVTFAFPYVFKRPLIDGYGTSSAVKLLLPPCLLVAVGYADDRFSLPPLVKLLGQLVAALVAVFVCGLGFSRVFPMIPGWLDAAITVFWLVGAINAFNLIDGLDGLASGISLIAVAGMAGTLFCIGESDLTFIHFALIGALLGFLRYNFHPASVFLGDCGSMYLGYLVAALPLLTRASNSFLVGVGIPMLAMGVPIFDTSLAIFRRTVRAALRRGTNDDSVGNDKMMTADTDHLHHRILRRFASQRKAAFALYGFAAMLVAIGVGGLLLKGRAVAMFILGFMAVAYIIFRDMRRIELWDAGRLLNAAAHDHSISSRRRRHLVRVPLLVALDLLVMVVAWVFTSIILSMPITESSVSRWLMIRMVPMFLSLIVFRTYATAWSRALLSNYVRLFAAVGCGSALSCVIVVLGNVPHSHMLVFTMVYGAFALVGLIAVRMVRAMLRDLFYGLDAGRLAESSEAQRIVVYGAGLRYRSFRRELVRSSASGNRVIVGLIDDDLLLKDQYIGGLKVYGTLEQAPDIIRRLRADAVVVAAVLTPERRQIARQVFARCGVKATLFEFSETSL